MIDTPTLISELRVHLGGLDDQDLPDNDALLLLNRAYWELLDRYKFREKEITANFPTVAGESFYAVPQPFDALQLVSIEDINTFQHTTLDRATNYQIENWVVNNPDTSARAKPIKYYRENLGIKLWPVPDQVYTIFIKYWTVLDDLVNSGSDLPGLTQNWHEVILQGGITRGFRRLGDFVRAKASLDEFERLNNVYELVPAKEEKDTHKGGLDVAGYDDVYNNMTTARDLRWPWR